MDIRSQKYFDHNVEEYGTQLYNIKEICKITSNFKLSIHRAGSKILKMTN
jgi:hypothetical protein